MVKTNNLFDFATGELTQDAILCWCLNWFNYEDEKMKEMAKKVIRLLTDVEIERENFINIHQQIKKSDILLCFPVNRVVWIIEDKVYTKEHGDQISVYKKEIKNLSKEKKSELGFEDDFDIKTTYFKTGFFYDDDKLANADRLVKGEGFYNILKDYASENAIVDMYCQFYKERYVDDYERNKVYQNIDSENWWDWNICRHHVAQHTFLKDVFIQHKWAFDRDFEDDVIVNDGLRCDSDEYEGLFKVYNGSSKGKPWTQIVIFSDKISTDSYNVFWRVDTEKRGPYISLRFYDWYDKKDDKRRQEHIDKYGMLKNTVEQIFNENQELPWSWHDVETGKKDNCFEAAIITIYLNDVLKNWEQDREGFTTGIEFVTDEFIKKMIEQRRSQYE